MGPLPRAPLPDRAAPGGGAEELHGGGTRRPIRRVPLRLLDRRVPG